MNKTQHAIEEDGMTLVALVDHWARERANDTAYVFLRHGEETSRLTFAALGAKTASLARELGDRRGQPLLVVCGALADTVCALFAAWRAGAIVVPCAAPRSRRARAHLVAVAADCGARTALVPADVVVRTREALGDVELVVVASAALDDNDDDDDALCVPATVGPDALALLQYTSGSTGAPKGVMISHRQLVANQRLMQSALATGDDTVLVGWLPLHHDMGLIGNVLHPFSLGRPAILLSPDEVVQQPRRWLEAISRYRATTSGGPISAYQWCCERIAETDFDLASWTSAVVGAEPVHADVLVRYARKFAAQGFAASAFAPCYGLAEATLLVTGGTAGVARARIHRDGRSLVSMGRPQRSCVVRIVDARGQRCADGEVGEICVLSPSIGRGYWRRDEESARTFRASIGGETLLRTGDLGFVSDGELFVQGRLKDVVIVRGSKLAAEDIEAVAARAHQALAGRTVAAFSGFPWSDARERVVVVCELGSADAAASHEIERAVRCALVANLDLVVDEVHFVAAATLPRTTSGKLRRAECRDAWRDGRLVRRARIDRVSEVGGGSEVGAGSEVGSESAGVGEVPA